MIEDRLLQSVIAMKVCSRGKIGYCHVGDFIQHDRNADGGTIIAQIITTPPKSKEYKIATKQIEYTVTDGFIRIKGMEDANNEYSVAGRTVPPDSKGLQPKTGRNEHLQIH